jgi:hypothetical protein
LQRTTGEKAVLTQTFTAMFVATSNEKALVTRVNAEQRGFKRRTCYFEGRGAETRRLAEKSREEQTDR